MRAMVNDALQALVDRVRDGDTRAVARACRLIDDRTEDSLALLKALYSHEDRAYVIGVTGTPGAGKSTLVDALLAALREKNKGVAVLAIDPTSPFSGGAILGDRIRMQEHFLDDAVFIRSVATRGHVGGLSRTTGDVLHVLNAAGFDVVLLETVGVGQDELEVARLAHTTLVVMAPGLGDDIQAIKAGILEIADVFAVNKADRRGADATVQDLQQMLSLRRTPSGVHKTAGHSAAASLRKAPVADKGEWVPPIVKTVASRREGIAELLAGLYAHKAFVDSSEEGARLRARRREAECRAVIREALADAFDARYANTVSAAVARVVAGEDDPYSVGEELAADAIGKPNDR